MYSQNFHQRINPTLKDPITYIIPGDPTPLARARFASGRAYDSQKQAKLSWGLQLANQHKDIGFFRGPIGLEVTFFMAVPQTRIKNLQKLINTHHVFKPDISNMLKWVEDCAQGILYQDDCVISQISCKKIYSDQPRTEFKIFGL